MRTRSVHMIVVAAVVVLGLVFLGNLQTGGDNSTPQSKVGILDDARGKGARRVKVTEARRAASSAAAKAAAKADAATSATDFASSSTVAGLITNEEGKPVENARITIRTNTGSFTRSVNSGKDGHFEAAQVPTGTYDVLATHDQYVTLIRPNYTLPPSEERVNLDFRLPLGAVINGDIVDEAGKPVEQVRVAARRNKAEQIAQGAKIFHDDSLYRTQITDKAGTFTLAGVALGPNLFEFVKPGYEAETRKMDIDPAKAKERLKITLKKTGLIAGLVVDDKGNPVSTATVHLTRYKPFQGKEEKLDKGKITATTNAQGKFEFKKLYNEGFYDLLVEEERFAPGIVPLVAVGSQKVTCQLEIGGIIEGTAQYIDRPTTPAALLIAAEAVVKGTTFTAQAQSDGAGRFSFGKLPYGSYKMYVDSPGYMAEPKEGVPCAKDKPTKDVALEVFEASVLRGRVADGADDRPVANATVTIKAAYGPGQARNRSFQTKSDAHGGFEFRQLPAGLHTALATARGYMRTLTDRSEQKFTLTPGEKKGDLALLLDHGGSVEGFVLDHNGRPIDRGEVQLFPASQMDGRVDATNLKGRTDVTGFFRIWGIEVGERMQLYASVRKKGYSKGRGELLDLTRDQPDVSTQIVLTPGGSISGKVVDKNKLPVPGAEVKFVSSAFPGDPSPSDLTVYSGADGSYQVNNCPAGDGSVAVSRSGYVKQGRGVSIREARVSDRVDFTLQTGSKIAGRVEDLYGNPIASATVTASPIEGAAGSDQDVTDKEGHFELSNLGTGRFNLAASFKLKTPEGEQNYHFLKPRVEINTREATIECDVGNSVAGRIEDEKGTGLKRFLVKLRSKGDVKPAQEFTFNLDRPLADAYGYFRVLKVPRGLYTMEVTADGYEPHRETEIAIGPHRSTDFPTIRMQPAGGVYGVVMSSSTNRPVNGATVRLLDMLLPEGEANAKASAGTTDYSGQFRVASVPPGTYKALVSHPSYLGLKVEDVIVTRRKQTGMGQLHLEAGGAVRGTVTDDEGIPLPNMQISVSGLAPGKATSTDQAGNFMLQGVQSGRWPIVARGHLNSRKVYAFQTVDVQRDSTERANFQMNTAADLDGILVSANSENPIKSGASVHIHPFDENQAVLEDVQYGATAKGNEFSISQVPAGQYFLWAAGYGAVSSFAAWQNIFLNRGKNQTVVDVPEGRLAGTVLDEQGNPVPGIGAQLYPMLGNLRLPRSLYNRLVRQQATNDSGQFVFDYLQPGAYQFLHQSPSGNWYALNPFGLARGQKISEYHVISPR